MEVVVGKTAGFCAGVSYAVNTASQELKENDKIYCLGELVHNKQVVENLEANGMITVEKLEDIPENSKVIFRAHGVPEEIYKKAEQKNLEVIDLTCGRVKVIHQKVQKEREKSFIIIVGKKIHPEVIGTKGFAGENSFVIETEDDILDAYMEYEKTNLGRVYVVSQTTFSKEFFNRLAKEIQINFIEADVIIDSTICDATSIRQEETKKMAKKIHTMVIIGGKNSSNTRELVKIAEDSCENVYAIETVEELKEIDFLGVDKIGIMAGASTPSEVIDEVVNYFDKKS